MRFVVHRSPFAVGGDRRLEAVRAFRCFDFLDQPRQHLLYVGGNAFKNCCLLWNKKPQVFGQQQEINQFVCRTSSNMEELAQFSVCGPSAALGNIGGDRNSRSSHLTAQTELLRVRIRRRCTINAQCQVMAFLPDFQTPEVLHQCKPSRTVSSAMTLSHLFTERQVPLLVLLSAQDRTGTPLHLARRFSRAANGERQTVNSEQQMPHEA